jgi:hypothetical protein
LEARAEMEEMKKREVGVDLGVCELQSYLNEEGDYPK